LDEGDDWVGGPRLFGSLWRYRLVIAVVAVVAAAIGFLVSLLLPARYEAQASLYLHDPGIPSVLSLSDLSSPQSGDHAVFMATEAGFASSDAVFGRALQLLKHDGTPGDLRPSVVVAPSADLASLTIRATADDPAEAAQMANAVGNAYQQLATEHIAGGARDAIARLQQVTDQRNVELDTLRAQTTQATGPDQATLARRAQHVADLIGSLQVHQDNIAAQAAVYGSGVQSFEPAVPPVSSSRPPTALLVLGCAVAGLIVAGGWAWWAAGRNRRVEVGGDAGAILGVPLLGETPRLGGNLRGTGDRSLPSDELDPVAAETYHFVLAALEHALSRVGGKAVAVASAGPGDGKTVTVLNLGLAAKREGRKVLLVDGDERTRRLSQLCRDGGHFDVVGVDCDGEEPSTAASKRWRPSPKPRPKVENVGKVLQIGPDERNGRHPAVFFRTPAFGKLLAVSDDEPEDLVLIDTPALLGVSEAVTIADHADAVLLVVNRGTSLDDLRRARERLAFTDTPLIGYLLNRGSAPRSYGVNYADRGSFPRGLLGRRNVEKPSEKAGLS
jgi:Mrp family chromosome partitioning ATPase/uncharacterized protein involved in exopolysaccharide biosynthesis